jgi:hypothetical protein
MPEISFEYKYEFSNKFEFKAQNTSKLVSSLGEEQIKNLLLLSLGYSCTVHIHFVFEVVSLQKLW